MKVSLFIPCTVDIMMPEIGVDTNTLLSNLGVQTLYHKEQTCCGQPLFNAGYRDHAKRVAKHFIEVFGEDDCVVSPAGSCVCMVKYHYPELLENEPIWQKRALDLAGRIYELSQYIVDVLKVTNLGATFAGKVTYHESCHILRGLNISAQPKKLIAGVEGTQFVELESSTACCGFGGEFAVAYPEISEAMVREKAANFVKSGADVLLLCEPGCLLNISGYLHRNHTGKTALHLASFLAQNIKKV
ncbi:MAG TPA: (Fe-S)-binding protein [Smithella sp.]|nr:(Fe-S)-binding protein [Smithella sp.]